MNARLLMLMAALAALILLNGSSNQASAQEGEFQHDDTRSYAMFADDVMLPIVSQPASWYHPGHETDRRNQRAAHDHRGQRAASHLRMNATADASWQFLYDDTRDVGMTTTTHAYCNDPIRSPETEAMRLLAELNLRDDGADSLAVRFLQAAARASTEDLEQTVRLMEYAEEFDSPRGQLILMASMIDDVCVPEAISCLQGLAFDDDGNELGDQLLV